MQKTKDMRLWEYENARSMEELFAELAELNFLQLAAKYDIPYPTLRGWARKMGVQIRRSVEFAGASQ